MRIADIQLDLQGSGQSWVIVHDGRAVSRHYRCHHVATARMAGLERQLAAPSFRRRACLSCGTAFTSEGAHHRMCDRCRAQA